MLSMTSSILILTKRLDKTRGASDERIFHFMTTGKAKQEIIKFFDRQGEASFGKDKTAVAFDGSYKPDVEDGEILSIKPFSLSEDLKNALMSPGDLPKYQIEKEPKEGSTELAKAIIVGECYKNQKQQNCFRFCAQRLFPAQNLRSGFNFLFSTDTFRLHRGKGLFLRECVDCLYENDELRFSSYADARCIFDLTDYYRAATDNEVDTFLEHEALTFENIEVAKKVAAKQRVRRRIKAIQDSQVLEKSVEEIQQQLQAVMLELPIKDGKIHFPADAKKIENVLAMLADDCFFGPFSNAVYVSNSKRSIQKRKHNS